MPTCGLQNTQQEEFFANVDEGMVARCRAQDGEEDGEEAVCEEGWHQLVSWLNLVSCIPWVPNPNPNPN